MFTVLICIPGEKDIKDLKSGLFKTKHAPGSNSFKTLMAPFRKRKFSQSLLNKFHIKYKHDLAAMPAIIFSHMLFKKYPIIMN